MAATKAVKEIFEALPYIKKVGAKHLWFDFEKEADVLYVSLERPQRATDIDILEDGILLCIFIWFRRKNFIGKDIKKNAYATKKIHCMV